LVYWTQYKQGRTDDRYERDSLGCSDDEMVEFRILRGGSRAKPGPQPWISRKQTNLFRDLFGRISWNMALGRKRFQESEVQVQSQAIHFHFI